MRSGTSSAAKHLPHVCPDEVRHRESGENERLQKCQKIYTQNDLKCVGKKLDKIDWSHSTETGDISVAFSGHPGHWSARAKCWESKLCESPNRFHIEWSYISGWQNNTAFHIVRKKSMWIPNLFQTRQSNQRTMAKIEEQKKSHRQIQDPWWPLHLALSWPRGTKTSSGYPFGLSTWKSRFGYEWFSNGFPGS